MSRPRVKEMDRINFDKLIVYLMAIANYAKDIHYNCSGPNFYGNHLFADRFVDNIYKYIDQIKEICLLGHNLKPLHSSEYLKLATETVPAGVNFNPIVLLMVQALMIIEDMKDISRGDENLIGAIAQDIQNNVGLLNIMFGDMN